MSCWFWSGAVRSPVTTLCGPAAAADPPDLDSAPPGSGSAPAAGSSPAPAPPQRTAIHLGSSGRRTGVSGVTGTNEKTVRSQMPIKRGGNKLPCVFSHSLILPFFTGIID